MEIRGGETDPAVGNGDEESNGARPRAREEASVGSAAKGSDLEAAESGDEEKENGDEETVDGS